MSAIEDFQQSLEHLKKVERFRSLDPIRTDGAYLITESNLRLCNFGSNDYLGFASRRAQREGQGAGSSALVAGWTDSHQELSRALADFEQTESACLFPSGYAACSGVVSTLATEADVIFSDSLNHASLIDGCRLSKAKCFVYPHRDVKSLRSLLSEHRANFRRAWIVTDSVFSMDGHLAPLVDLCDAGEAFEAGLIVDEAHATGVLGECGAGLTELLGVKDRVSVVIGTLSKAIGSHGGFAASDETTINYLINHCRPLIYSTALPPTSVMAAARSLKTIQESSHERKHVKSLAMTLRGLLGLAVEHRESSVPIVPVIIGTDKESLAASLRLRDSGFYVPAIRPPTVPEGTARLRISLTALHTEKMLEDLVSCLNAR